MNAFEDFTFYDPGTLIDDDLQLVLVKTVPGNTDVGRVPEYTFRMTPTGQNERMGTISLRVGQSPLILCYAGHIGYGVEPDYRGHHYAARACKLLLPLARRHDLNPIWITCNPDNFASRRTCELAGAQFVEIVDVPEDLEMYQKGDVQKCRYRLDL